MPFFFQTKLQWLCEELKDRENREKSLRHQLMMCRQQLRNMTENKESELQCLFEQIERQEQLLEEIHREKRGGLAALTLMFLCLYSWNSRIGGKPYFSCLQFILFPHPSLFLIFPSFLGPEGKLTCPESFPSATMFILCVQRLYLLAVRKCYFGETCLFSSGKMPESILFH